MPVKLKWVTPEAEKQIMHCARVSNPANQTSTDSRLLSYCAKNGHWSIFELASMCVEINTTRTIARQILRHRSFSFQEFSQRYAAVDSSGIEIYAARRQDTKNRQNSIADISPEIAAEWDRRQLENWKSSFEHYTWALDNEIAKECARMVLPLQTKTRMFMNGTLRSWVHYISLRADTATQAEHQEIASAIKAQLCESFPIVAEAAQWITI